MGGLAAARCEKQQDCAEREYEPVTSSSGNECERNAMLHAVSLMQIRIPRSNKRFGEAFAASYSVDVEDVQRRSSTSP